MDSNTIQDIIAGIILLALMPMFIAAILPTQQLTTFKQDYFRGAAIMGLLVLVSGIGIGVVWATMRFI